jgi:hypothetical protein
LWHRYSITANHETTKLTTIMKKQNWKGLYL